MNYYYDLFLNFNENNLMFYEWDQDDDLEFYKRVPLFQVSTGTLKDFLENNIEVSKEFLKTFESKAKGKGIIPKYIAIFADKNSAIALEFSEDGKSIARSFLELDDELNLIDSMYTLRLEKINYRILNSIKYQENLRIEEKISKFINTEINGLIEHNDYKKLKYLYMEWFNKIPLDNEELLKTIKNRLNGEIGKKEIKIYNIIKLSYSKV